MTIYPRRELTPLQYKMMSTQPDMIHQYALAVAERYGGPGRARVHARAYASLNGRPSQRLIDERKAAKQRRDFARADEIRRSLAERGILLEDSPAGTRWKKK